MQLQETAQKNMQLEKHRKIEANCLYVFMWLRTMACHVGLLYDLKVLVLSRTSWRVLVTCLRAKSNKTSWVHSVLRQTCSIVSAKPSLTSNSAVVEQNHFHKDYNCVCFSSYIFFCAVSCSCIPVANSSCKFYFHWGKHSQARQSLKPDI